MTALPEDRKSTRLNSSHVSISYAVFCLIPPPPTPPLFPYTTLFRSHHLGELHGDPQHLLIGRDGELASQGLAVDGWLDDRADLRVLQQHPGCDFDALLLVSHDCSSRRSEEHTSELQSRFDLVCRLLLDTTTSDPSTLSLHDALPISPSRRTARRSPTPSHWSGRRARIAGTCRRWLA